MTCVSPLIVSPITFPFCMSASCRTAGMALIGPWTLRTGLTSFLFHSTGSLPWPVALMLCITQSTTLRGILWYKLKKKTKIKGCVRACVCQLRAGKQPCASAICVACINGATHSTHRPQASSLKPQAFKQAYVTTLVRLLDSARARCQGAGPCDCSSLQLVGCSPASSPGVRGPQGLLSRIRTPVRIV